MRLEVSISRALVDGARRLLHPGRSAGFFLLLIFLFFVCTWDWRNPFSALLLSEMSLAALALTAVWLWISFSPSMSRRGFEYVLASSFLLSMVHIWLRFEHLEVSWLIVLLTGGTSVFFGTQPGILLAAVSVTLLFAGRRQALIAPEALAVHILTLGAVLAGSALLLGRMGRNQRSRILELREELARAKAAPFAYGAAAMPEGRKSMDIESSEPEARMESLDQNILAILQRVKEYLGAHTVLLFLPADQRVLTIRHAVSDSHWLDREYRLDLERALLGRAYGRGVACNWNLLDPDCHVSLRDIGYYLGPEAISNLAACPLLSQELPQGLLVADRVRGFPFSEVELLHLESFAIQLIEIIQMGKRYLEQVDRNTEYRLFYSAMEGMGQSLATAEMVEALATAAAGIAPSSHFIVALLDEAGLSYEIALARGAEKLSGSRQRSRGKTWIAWMLQSDSGPLLLRDIRSHVTRMPIASLSEEALEVRSVMLIPLKSKERKLGLVLLGSEQADAYQNWQLRLVNMLCSHAASGIENSLLHRQVENEAISDGLTRLKNHRYFQERLRSECSRARRQSASLSLLMIDIDHFKRINDTYGHRVGDVMLQQIGGILKATVRSEDAVARYGGEEFVVILTQSNRKGAMRMAERTRTAVEKVSFHAEEHLIKITVSIGSATFPEDATEPWELIERADQALYAAKAMGRNRVSQYQQGLSRDTNLLRA